MARYEDTIHLGGRKEWTLARYNSIPSEILQGHVLEVGARYGRILHSEHRNKVLELNRDGKWLSMDLAEYHHDFPLKNESTNLFDVQEDRTWDTIIALEFIEHICVRDWGKMFSKFKSLLNEGGHLYLTTPYKEPIMNIPNYYENHGDDPANIHVVFGIDEILIQYFLPDAICRVLKMRHPFRDEGDTLTHAVFRELHRIITRHRYSFRFLKPEKWLSIQWQKK
ncbi:MAG: methyltransferase domain-containing protein [Candidatus Thorarchaeota archaeon]|jgi:hypothetical protein